MFKTKYITSLLNVKWEPIKRNLKLNIIPRIGEYLYFNEEYYEVINVVHMLNNKQEYFIIVNGIGTEIK
jgi:hypothetical protein